MHCELSHKRVSSCLLLYSGVAEPSFLTFCGVGEETRGKDDLLREWALDGSSDGTRRLNVTLGPLKVARMHKGL